MNWEVQTMPSKTSFCNGTEFRKCLSRWWPLWGIYGVILFILLRYGCAVSEVAQKVQSSVFAALEGMTGFQVNAVNVHVGGISFD